jgi:hypothetical protein
MAWPSSPAPRMRIGWGWEGMVMLEEDDAVVQCDAVVGAGEELVGSGGGGWAV